MLHPALPILDSMNEGMIARAHFKANYMINGPSVDTAPQRPSQTTYSLK